MCRGTHSSMTYSPEASHVIEETCKAVDVGASGAIVRVDVTSDCHGKGADEELHTKDPSDLLEFDDTEDEDSIRSSTADAEKDLPLDMECCPSFAELISDCQQYAQLSGCRFHIREFDGIDIDPTSRIPVVSEARAEDAASFLSAKLRAASSVRNFTDRLKKGDADLLSDLAQASELVAKESARNAMIASCKAADCFPPSPPPAGVSDDDCAWDAEELASVDVIAQRLYNDEAQRLLNIASGRIAELVHAKTASFVLEFADEVGISSPQMSVQRMEKLAQFQDDIEVFSSRSMTSEESSASKGLPEPAVLALALGAGALGLGIALSVGGRLAATRQRR